MAPPAAAVPCPSWSTANMQDQLRVIGVGFGRTGTFSLRAALERLGFGPCYHMWEVIYDPARAVQWHRIGSGHPADWQAVFDGYRSSVDWPGAAYWRELVDAFPEAKVVLTVRDPDRWYESARKTIFRFPLRRHNAAEQLVYRVVSRLNPNGAATVPNMLDTVVWGRVFGGHPFDGRPGDREFAIETFQRHVKEVTEYVPAERLLVFEVAQGWEPLCAFLGLPVPDEPFPMLNESEDFFLRMLKDRRWSAQRPLVVAGAGIGGVAAAAGGVAAAAGATVGMAFGIGLGTLALVGTVVAALALRRADRLHRQAYRQG